ncbi:site-specific integrase [Pseudomonas mucidolens]|uniref:tyrosine-type recombinase/integrase n=1 Tax=Pseudomonas mucidolens TaxID=46679 RepID=UPI0030D94699
MSQIDRHFDKDILPWLGDLPVVEVSRQHVLEVLRKIERYGGKVPHLAVVAWKVSSVPPRKSSLPLVTGPMVSSSVEARPIVSAVTLCICRTFGLVAQPASRLVSASTGELRLATPDQFDLEKRLWVIPAEVVKQLQLAMRKPGKQAQNLPPYIVPLSVQALEIVRYMLDQVVPAQRYLFAHRSDLSKRISENTLNGALRRVGYADQLTGHGMRATISTALNEIGYPKVWVDAQLSHADPDKVSAAYNHAEYVEQRRTMMQDWANRLDLWGQGQLKAANSPLTIRLEGAASLPLLENAKGNAVLYSSFPPASAPAATLDCRENAPMGSSRLPVMATPIRTEKAHNSHMSDIQSERAETLATFEASSNLPLLVFARLAGKPRDQINRDIKARRLLSLSLGNRGQRIPDWQLDPLRCMRPAKSSTQPRKAKTWCALKNLSGHQFCKRLPNTSCSMFSVCLGVGNLPRRYPVPHGWSQGV